MSFIVEKLNREDSFHRELLQTDLRSLKIDFYRKFYPNVENWYKEKLIEGFRDGLRIVHIVRKDSLLYGMSIARVSPSKLRHKLCTFFLLSEARGNGAGLELMNQTMHELALVRVAMPVIVTIPEERLNEKVGGKRFLDFLAEFGFFLEAKEANRYRLGKDEYVCVAPTNCRSLQVPYLKVTPGIQPNIGITPDNPLHATSTCVNASATRRLSIHNPLKLFA